MGIQAKGPRWMWAGVSHLEPVQCLGRAGDDVEDVPETGRVLSYRSTID